MANINDYADAYDDELDNNCLSPNAAQSYAQAVATEALQEYIKQTGGIPSAQTGGPNMDTTQINVATEAVMTETKTNAAIISGEILLDNIQTVAEKVILSRLSWWQKLTITTKNKELSITLATYAIVHAIKTGGFGLTRFKVNHVALDYVTLAANARLLKYVVKATGVDTNVAESFLTMPNIEG